MRINMNVCTYCEKDDCFTRNTDICPIGWRIWKGGKYSPVNPYSIVCVKIKRPYPNECIIEHEGKACGFNWSRNKFVLPIVAYKIMYSIEENYKDITRTDQIYPIDPNDMPI